MEPLSDLFLPNDPEGAISSRTFDREWREKVEALRRPVSLEETNRLAHMDDAHRTLVACQKPSSKSSTSPASRAMARTSRTLT